MSAGAQERREYPRRSLAVPLSTEIKGERLRGQVVDIGLHGLRCRLNGCDPELGEDLQVTFEVAGKLVSPTIRVIWLHRAGPDQHEVGTEFINLSTTAQGIVREYVASQWLSEHDHY